MLDVYVKLTPFLQGELTIHSAVGAGDTFIAGMIFAMVEHSETWTLQRKLEFANELAGRKVYQEGFKNLISGYVRDGGALGPE
jgi:ketohexokinase